jgi:ribosomal protein S7
LATVENELKMNRRRKKPKKRLTYAHKWIDNARRMRLQQMFDGMSTEMWDAKKKGMEDEKKKDDQGSSKDMAKK